MCMLSSYKQQSHFSDVFVFYKPEEDDDSSQDKVSATVPLSFNKVDSKIPIVTILHSARTKRFVVTIMAHRPFKKSPKLALHSVKTLRQDELFCKWLRGIA